MHLRLTIAILAPLILAALALASPRAERARSEPRETPNPATETALLLTETVRVFTPSATMTPTTTPTSTPTVRPTSAAMLPFVMRAGAACDPAYPTVCIPPAPPDLDCDDIPHRFFPVLPPDPHRFDANNNGIGCEVE